MARFPAFLKLDVRKYFDSVSHIVLCQRLERRFKDERLLALLWQILDVYHTSPGRRLLIGSLTSQHFANFYLGWFDRFVKEVIRSPGYVRYMDDCVLWGATSAERRQSLARTKLNPRPFRAGSQRRTLGTAVFLGAAVPRGC
ncbi:MAG: hypothetical protein RLY70_2663 [Planctomycetota bacterium]|jgi:retron-type reverse transcriptase